MNILIIGNETAFKQNLLAVIADKTHWQVETLETGSLVLEKGQLTAYDCIVVIDCGTYGLLTRQLQAKTKLPILCPIDDWHCLSSREIFERLKGIENEKEN
ncbi:MULTISPECIES: hypothetical protein [unclassified Lactococcus]|uniref:hypothetical protein n=1 Tax=unclassified Lactococcus TaxID=2643510 RepID=UPI0011CA4489|nr:MULTISPECIES: hypothetical protein [unclassified Lactococcus]MQW23642.1 hypothetical protein [Lactococcus sp. dk101]TXK37623.1 hypothetical protein FVP42_08235 [Lactococcus sp. dk310]TXK49061.1 hypothetical protein FVP43_08205 [Lactococcus sp. dk322]